MDPLAILHRHEQIIHYLERSGLDPNNLAKFARIENNPYIRERLERLALAKGASPARLALTYEKLLDITGKSKVEPTGSFRVLEDYFAPDVADKVKAIARARDINVTENPFSLKSYKDLDPDVMMRLHTGKQGPFSFPRTGDVYMGGMSNVGGSAQSDPGSIFLHEEGHVETLRNTFGKLKLGKYHKLLREYAATYYAMESARVYKIPINPRALAESLETYVGSFGKLPRQERMVARKLAQYKARVVRRQLEQAGVFTDSVFRANAEKTTAKVASLTSLLFRAVKRR